MAYIGDMMMEGLAGGIDDSAGEVMDSAMDMTKDLNSVFNDLSADFAAEPLQLDVNKTINGVNDTALGGGSGLTIQLNIDNFNNYSGEDIADLTNEIMETAGNFMKRKGAVFA